MAGQSDFNTRQTAMRKPKGKISGIWVRLGKMFYLFTAYERDVVENCGAEYSDLVDEAPQHEAPVTPWSQIAGGCRHPDTSVRA